MVICNLNSWSRAVVPNLFLSFPSALNATLQISPFMCMRETAVKTHCDNLCVITISVIISPLVASNSPPPRLGTSGLEIII